MKAIVESLLPAEILAEYLLYINKAKNRSALEFIIKDLTQHPEFYLTEYGFSGSHFWVANRQTKKRAIFVPFEQI
jgi:hypothetical protein